MLGNWNIFEDHRSQACCHY